MSRHKRVSNRIYIQLERKDMAVFKFFLESWDNLAYMSVVDKYRAVVQLVYAPDSCTDLDAFLAATGREIELKEIYRGLNWNE